MPAKKLRSKKNPKVLGRRAFRVSRSRTGLGVFATKPIKKNAYIVEYLGPLLTNAQCDARRDNRYWFEVNARWTIDGSSRKNVARYINHSCRGNSDVYINAHRIKIRAIKNIEPGQEITYDYGEEYFELFLRRAGCRCAKCSERGKKRGRRR